MTDTATADVRRASYRRCYEFGDVWVQKCSVSGRWRWRIPQLAPFKDWSFSRYSTWDDAFDAAERAVTLMPSSSQPEVYA